MSDQETPTVIAEEEINTNPDPIPLDINFEKRKQIVKEQLDKLLGASIKNKIIEKQRVNNIKFNKVKTRRKLANASRRRNRM